MMVSLTFSLWEKDRLFYKFLQKIYKACNTKGLATLRDTFSLPTQVCKRWARAMPLHLLIGQNYLNFMMVLLPSGFWLLLDTTCEESK